MTSIDSPIHEARMAQEREKVPLSDRTLFVVFGVESFTHFRRWLATREYNTVVTGLKDKRGDAMVGLSWDNNDGEKLDKRGVVIVKSPDLMEQVEEVLGEFKKN